MKALFLVDNIPAMEMFEPIIGSLPNDWGKAFVNYDGWAEQSRLGIQDYAKRLGVRCELLGDFSRRGVERMCKREQPSILVQAREETTPVERLFVEVGNDRDIPTLLVPHGILTPNDRLMWGSGRLFRLKSLYRLVQQAYRRLRKGDISIVRLMEAGLFRVRNDFRDGVTLTKFNGFSMIAAYGEAMVDILVSYNVSPENIRITGNPKFDIYHENGDTQQVAILLLTGYYVEFGIWHEKQRDAYVKSVAKVAERLNCKLVIKIHPFLESKEDYLKIAKIKGNAAVICQHEPLPKLVNACSLAVTLMSSAGLEAMAAKKPLVVYNPYNDITLYHEMSGASIAYNEEALFQIIEGITQNGMGEGQSRLAERFVYRQAYIQDGKAAERIADLIIEMGQNG